jgi:hypothetical protein
MNDFAGRINHVEFQGAVLQLRLQRPDSGGRIQQAHSLRVALHPKKKNLILLCLDSKGKQKRQNDWDYAAES